MKEDMAKTKILLSEVLLFISGISDEIKDKTNEKILNKGKVIVTGDKIFTKNEYLAQSFSNKHSFILLLVSAYISVISEIIICFDSPITRFPLRTIMEIAFKKIPYYLSLSEDGRKQLAARYWLVNYATLLSSEPNQENQEIYNHLLDILTSVEEKSIYAKLREQNYLVSEICKIRKHIFKAPTTKIYRESVEPYLLNISGEVMSFDSITRMVGDQSDFLHDNLPLLQHLKEESSDKTHSFYVSSIIFLTANQIVSILSAQYSLDKEKEIERLRDKMLLVGKALFNCVQNTRPSF